MTFLTCFPVLIEPTEMPCPPVQTEFWIVMPVPSLIATQSCTIQGQSIFRKVSVIL